MPFESLSFRYNFKITNFPERWLPLIHLYDPDLPLFPVYYFHAISNTLSKGQRPNYSDRIFGFVEKINVTGHNTMEVYLVVNKDLTLPENAVYKNLAENEVRERFGLNNPVRLIDINNAFLPPLDYANPVLGEIWDRVVSNTYGNLLPFGRLWDEILGLTRFVASWNSDKGRKGELIQTHYFCSKFGERIQSGGGINNTDFFLLPTVTEILDRSNPLNIFPGYARLMEVADIFQANNCTYSKVGSLDLSRFQRSGPGKFDTKKFHDIVDRPYMPAHLRSYAIECFNALNKGPQRSVIFLMLLSDLRKGKINPALLTNSDLGCVYDQMERSYQSPKVIHIYSQQSFGNSNAIPIDIWIETFLKYPLNIEKSLPPKNKYQFLLSRSSNIGKVERLLWVAAQARKVHSSACNNALWCIKKAGKDQARGANPLACKVCILRSSCPSYEQIKKSMVVFNSTSPSARFHITTSEGNNTTPNQKFVSCTGKSIYEDINDNFSSVDVPGGFLPYPSKDHSEGKPISVEDFIKFY